MWRDVRSSDCATGSTNKMSSARKFHRFIPLYLKLALCFISYRSPLLEREVQEIVFSIQLSGLDEEQERKMY